MTTKRSVQIFLYRQNWRKARLSVLHCGKRTQEDLMQVRHVRITEKTRSVIRGEINTATYPNAIAELMAMCRKNKYEFCELT